MKGKSHGIATYRLQHRSLSLEKEGYTLIGGQMGLSGLTIGVLLFVVCAHTAILVREEM